MADQSDVEKGFVTLIDSILYPTGQSGSPPLTIVGAPCRVERGWPDQRKLDADLAAGILNVSVYPRPNMERNTTRYRSERVENPVPATTYTLGVAGQVITVGGAAPSPFVEQNLAIYINGYPYVVGTTAGMTAAQIAAALQALIVVDVPGTSVVGAAITLPSGLRIGPLRVGSTGSTTREVGRQEKHFQIVFWCPDPDLRDLAVSTVDAAMRALNFLTLADGSAGRMIYHGSNQMDAPQKELLYRRDLFYSVEYATTITEVATQIVAEIMSVQDRFGTVIVDLPLRPIVLPLGGMLDFSDPNNSGLLPGI